MSASDDDNELTLDSVFPEEERPPTPEPTTATYTRDPERVSEADDWRELAIQLVGSHPLWGHHLWNAARSFANFLDRNADAYCKGKRVLELGAGGGLPGIVTALLGAEHVLLTDYPDAPLLKNLEHNVSTNIPEHARLSANVLGYIWGKDTTPLLTSSPDGFDLILMSDLVFNHSQHDALLKTCEASLGQRSPESDAETPCLLVFYTHHRPHLAHRDLGFFEKARHRGWDCEEIVTERFGVMFHEDSGDEEVRATVHGWRVRRRSQ
ncbi:nicotinamide N-methyltransferase [Auricularia subglabra TFB-10046 SS5]|nr:nicotinamide N-methyltransferase [Auricularia subglabra TFB-10046 SS5]